MAYNHPLNSRSRRVAAALLLCGALLFLVLLGPLHQDSATTQAVASSSAPSQTQSTPPPVIATAPPQDGHGLVPIIDAIEMEKPDVCLGEENLVTVHAHTAGHAEDGYLHYRGAVGAGQFLVFRGQPPEPDQSGRPTAVRTEPIGVFGKANAAVYSQAAFRVKDCKVDHKLLVQYAVLPNTTAEFAFTARLVPFGTPVPFKAVRYEWDFGAGNVVNTTEPQATHDFTERLHAHLFESFLITVTAIDASGKRLVGRTGLELPSHYFYNLQTHHMVTLLVRMTPRMPQMDANGVVTQSYRLWHFDPQPVQVTEIFKREVTVESLYENPSVGTGHRTEVKAQQVPDIRSVLGTTVIPPSGIEFTFKLDTTQSPLVAIDYHIAGVTSTGLRVRGQFALMRPPIPPTREHHIPITDPVLKAKIERAQELTGHEVITAEELARLEKEGRFDDLKPTKPQPETTPPVAARPEAVAPGHP